MGESLQGRAGGVERPLRFAIIGAGMSGILSAIKLRKAGFDDFTIYEKAERLGGTWRENTYPGIACDVPSHLYSYSFEPNPEWSHRFSPGAEIQGYFEERGQNDGASWNASVSARRSRVCERAGGRWQLTTKGGQRDEVDVVIAATGVLHHPNLPQLAGLEDFDGALFHSARWDHGIALDGKRIGIIGTGSTAVQIVSALVDRVAKLSLFQRTAQWIAPQENPPFSEAEKDEMRRHPEQMRQLHDELSRLFAESFSNARGRREFTADEDARGRLPRESREQRARPRAAREAAPELPGRVQAPDHLVGLLSSHPEAERRARQRGHRAHRGRAACAPATADCTSSTCWCSPPASGSTASCARSKCSEPRAGDSRRCGRSGRSPTSRSRSRAFRTCSCSTARTVPSATSP